MSRRHHEEEPVKVEIDEEQQDMELEMESEAPSIDELQEEVERQRVELEETRKQVSEEHDRYLRALADFSNYRRRHQDEYAQALQTGTREVILKMLPVLDNFERAVEASEQQHSYESLIEGVLLIQRQLNDLLEKEGVKPIEAVGQEFDPMLHDAIMRVETDEYPENTIVEELQKGYIQDDKVLRPAKVKVAVQPD